MNKLQSIKVTSIDSISTIHYPKAKTTEVNCRKWYGLSFCTAGRITYRLNGQSYVSIPGCAIFLPKGQTYRLHAEKGGCFPLINFQCEGFSTDTFLVVPIQNPEPFLSDFEQMKSLVPFPGKQLKVMSIFYDLLDRLSVHQNETDSPLSAATKYLEEHIGEPTLSNQTLAQQIGFSEVYFRKLFSRQYGISPKQHIMDLRIRKAKHLLADGIASITSISEDCGFSSVYHFSRCFKDRVGMSPTEYARMNRISKL